MMHAAAARGEVLDAFVVRKEGKAHGLQRRIEGAPVEGRRVLAVEDTSTTGGSALTAVEALREAGAEVVAWPWWSTGTPAPPSASGGGTAVPLRDRQGRAGAVSTHSATA